nr:tombus P33-like protein [Tolivirales sp.]
MSVDAQQILVLTKWGGRWLKHAWGLMVEGGARNQVAASLLAKLDAEKGDPEQYVDAHVYESTHTVHNAVSGTKTMGTVQRTKAVLQKGRRSNFAACIAQIAYNKFGERKMSEANILVTRKWIQKLLDEPKYKDLRMCDKNLAIDRALFLSFVPTNAFRQMKLAIETPAWKDRCANENVFGKVFRLISGSAVAGSDPGYEMIA